MPTENTRRSDRVGLGLRIEVSATDLNGQVFVEQARTIVISHHGATVAVSRKLAPEQELTIRCVGSGRQAQYRLMGEVRKQADRYVYAVALRDESVNPWDLKFAPLTESEKAIGRVLLECGGCQSRELVYLNELDLELFEVTRSLSRPCRRCQASTLWGFTRHEEPIKQLSPQVGAAGALQPSPVANVRTRNGRKKPRMRLKLTACVRQPGFEEGVVICDSISRGGLCFTSAKRYFEGTWIEVAIPYSPEAANIFVPAKIVYSKKAEGGFRHGVQYLKRRTG